MGHATGIWLGAVTIGAAVQLAQVDDAAKLVRDNGLALVELLFLGVGAALFVRAALPRVDRGIEAYAERTGSEAAGREKLAAALVEMRTEMRAQSDLLHGVLVEMGKRPCLMERTPEGQKTLEMLRRKEP